ncbi:proteoglycan 3 [Rousettus aegyptiacus]|uniref:Proteoglycan 3, pro eosinophil major basic protein 2 n=1 Tax=Rousettus aegyptiacus TaxID=9407 RepID=A0A7J8H4H5_ROUAE|nr:proteoglycan 3 [Rousettus aegyptiacus]KAF6467234.1 proteoglycan 3, pro eosinophil major basic protein 2 [Rousettus aegyptiacus]
MKRTLLLPLLLLGTVAALHLKIDAPHRDTGETQPDLSQGLEGSGEPEGELALPENVIRSEGAEVEASGCHNDFEIEESMESDPGALDEDLQCPREEDVVKMQGGPEFKTCRYVLVHQCKTFRNAQEICRRCYRGNLVSIHNFRINSYLQQFTYGLNRPQVWIGARFSHGRACWIDRSCWNFGVWAPGQPKNGGGKCVSLCTGAGYWRRTPCNTRMPFICSFLASGTDTLP